MFYIPSDALPSIEDFLNLLTDPSAKPKTASEDKSVDDMVLDFLNTGPDFEVTDWFTFNKAFEFVSDNLHPSIGIDSIFMTVATLDEDEDSVESLVMGSVVEASDEYFFLKAADGSSYGTRDINSRFRFIIPKKDIRKLNLRSTVSEVTLNDGSLLESGTVVKGGVLFVSDAGEVDVYRFSDIKDFVV